MSKGQQSHKSCLLLSMSKQFRQPYGGGRKLAPATIEVINVVYELYNSKGITVLDSDRHILEQPGVKRVSLGEQTKKIAIREAKDRYLGKFMIVCLFKMADCRLTMLLFLIYR